MLSEADLPELHPHPPLQHTHTHNPLLVKEKVPTFVRIPGIDAASRVTCTVRGLGQHARMLARAAAGFRESFKLRGEIHILPTDCIQSVLYYM